MADATWPVTLPTDFDVNGYNEKEPDNSITQKMEVGPSKMRRRSTAKPRPIKGQRVYTNAQVEILSTFYQDTLFSGVLTFDGLLHPRTGATVDWQFVSPPSYVPYGKSGVLFVVSYDLQILP